MNLLSVTSAAFALAVTLRPARADFRFAIHNDAFSDASRPLDDNGFTNDVEIALWRRYRGLVVGGRLFDRWVTEALAGGAPGTRRQDLIELVATVAHRWTRGWWQLDGEARGGPVVTGNWGGRWIQNGYHSLCRCGSVLSEGLQRDYIEDRRGGALVGGRAIASVVRLWWLRGYGSLDSQASLATGVSFVDGALGGALGGRHGRWLFGGFIEAAVMRFHVASDPLAIPGGYRPGFQFAVRGGVYAAWRRIRIDYELHTNESGSGEPQGVVAITIKQAGDEF